MSRSFSSDDIQAYLDRIVEAGAFTAGSLRYRLLEYLLRVETEGRGETLKAYTIGIDVLGKPDSFDPATDSSVRVGIGRLRTALALFENSDDADTVLKVDIPVGTYRPTLSARQGIIVEGADAEPSPTNASKSRTSRRWVIRAVWALGGFATGLAALAGILIWLKAAASDQNIVLEVENFTGDPVLADQTASSLRRVLANSKAIRVISDNDRDAVSRETDLILNGTVARTGNGQVDLSIELTSAETRSIIWAKAAQLEDDVLLQSRIAQNIGSELRVRVFGASKIDLATRDPATLSPEQLFMMATWVPGPAVNAVDWELERINLMSLALEKDPDFGAAHSVMADKLAYLANVYGPANTPEQRRRALTHAQRARELSPLNPDVMFNVAQALWHSGEIAASKATMERVVDLDEGHDLARFLSVMIPYTCRIPPDSVVAWATEFDANLSPDNPIRWLTLTWISWLKSNRGEFEAALVFEKKAALIFQIPYTFMRHAMLLNRLGETEKAAAIVAAQTANWPDIDPRHFATVTVPRLCSEDPDHPAIIANYVALADALQK